MDIITVWQQSLLSAWQDLSTRFLLFLPNFLGGILVFIVGIFVSGWLSQLVSYLLRKVRFQDLTRSAGIDTYLKKADIRYDSVGLVSAITKWFVLLVFFVSAVNIMGFREITLVLDDLVAFVSRVMVATVIIAIGFFIANLVEGLVRGALVSVDHEHAKPIARLARWLVLVVAVMAGINELQIAQPLVQTFFQGLTWTITLAVGLAVDLGSKDVVADLLKDWRDKLGK